MGYNEIIINGVNKNETIHRSNELIIELIKSISDIKDTIIQFDLEIIAKTHDDEELIEYVSEGQKTFLNKTSMKCVDLKTKSKYDLSNFLSFLIYSYEMDIIMSSSEYNNFRSIFTRLYTSAFGDICNSPNYIYDTYEINLFLELNRLKYRILKHKTKDEMFLYKLVDDKTKDEDIIWEKTYIEKNEDTKPI